MPAIATGVPMTFMLNDKQFIVARDESAVSHLYLRRLDQPEPSRLCELERGGNSPMISPDGQWVAFWERGRLRKISVLAGPATTLAEAAGRVLGSCWAADGSFLYISGAGSDLFQVGENGGMPKKLAALGEGENQYVACFPYMLPDSSAVLYAARRGGWRPPQS